jgi:hypothetical protein
MRVTRRRGEGSSDDGAVVYWVPHARSLAASGVVECLVVSDQQLFDRRAGEVVSDVDRAEGPKSICIGTKSLQRRRNDHPKGAKEDQSFRLGQSIRRVVTLMLPLLGFVADRERMCRQ